MFKRKEKEDPKKDSNNFTFTLTDNLDNRLLKSDTYIVVNGTLNTYLLKIFNIKDVYDLTERLKHSSHLVNQYFEVIDHVDGCYIIEVKQHKLRYENLLCVNSSNEHFTIGRTYKVSLRKSNDGDYSINGNKLAGFPISKQLTFRSLDELNLNHKDYTFIYTKDVNICNINEMLNEVIMIETLKYFNLFRPYKNHSSFKIIKTSEGYKLSFDIKNDKLIEKSEIYFKDRDLYILSEYINKKLSTNILILDPSIDENKNKVDELKSTIEEAKLNIEKAEK